MIAMKRNLYPPIEPFSATYTDMGDGHEIYVEQSGNKNGIPVIFVHGGPGGGTSPLQRRFFDPAFYHIILLVSFRVKTIGFSRSASAMILFLSELEVKDGVPLW